MNAETALPDHVRQSVRRLLDAIDNALSASREVERARDALVREAERLQQLRVVSEEGVRDE
jgi:hypothetical protein